MNKEQAVAEILDRSVGQIKDLPTASLEARPGIAQISDELTALELKGGPADAVAYHDFHVLQMAFKHVWAQAFDQSIYENVEELFNQTVKLCEDADLAVPDFGAIADVQDLRSLLGSGGGVVVGPPAWVREGLVPAQPPAPVPMSPELLSAFPQARFVWSYLTQADKVVIQNSANVLDSNLADEDKAAARNAVTIIIEQAEAKLGRLSKLVLDIGIALSEPYTFDIFAPNTYNFGIMLTYRQRWEPLTYQAGDLVATIPLAPGESRKYSRREVVKKTQAEKEIEKSMRSRADQSSETGRAESEIMKRASSSTNFKMTSSGSFNIGIGSISASNEFATNQANESAGNKKEFHEATVKAAEEYRLERSIEVDTTASTETDETVSGEISNPNNEITVTYLFYELQRRYRVSERIHRARPVILVAQDVPAPHEINEAWLISYQWILARVLLDDSLRPALQYLSSGFAGDEAAIDILKANWETENLRVQKYERALNVQLQLRDDMRGHLVDVSLRKQELDATGLPILKNQPLDLLEAERAHAETQVKYLEQALEDAQRKLKQETDSLDAAARQYADAMQKKFTRHVAIDQLRLHVKQNILYYMQAIWDHEPTDQRFFRLYNKKVKCPKPPPGIDFSVTSAPANPFTPKRATFSIQLSAPSFDAGDEVELVEVADLDNPLGYKGNYMILPLKRPCDLALFMLSEFVDEYFGVRDPDEGGAYTFEQLEEWLTQNLMHDDVPLEEKTKKERLFIEKLGQARPVSDEIIVPTRQLFIEALPGRHPLLEDFKLRHRIEDLHKVQAEVRHAELENLRLAARLVEGQADTQLLDDPDVEKKIVIEGGAAVVVEPNA